MDFATLVIFLILYYIRPQEWIASITELKPVKWSVVLALVAMVMRHRGFQVRDFLRTPHDWLMLLYFAWIVLSNRAPVSAFLECYTLFVFYLVTVQALASSRRIQAFLGWWMFMILVVAGLAVVALYGYDLVGSGDLTRWHMKGRLSFNTSIFNNPNSLGHSVYPAVFLAYFLLFWKRPVFMKIATIFLLFLPLYCVFLTVSKGAFIGVFVTLVAALAFGRPRSVQLAVLVGAMTIGWGTLWSMPRMVELQKSSRDTAIQGRVAAFKFGLYTLKNNYRGVGIQKFSGSVERMFGFKKAAHSSYVQVGGELGWPGLLLFTGILYACLRTLLFAKTTDETEERVRRMLFVMLISYAVSSWMVNWPWRATLFLMVGAIAAFHRVMLAKSLPPKPEAEALMEPMPPPTFPNLQPTPALSAAFPTTFNQVTQALPTEKGSTRLSREFSETTPDGLRWNYLGIVDLVLIVAFTLATVWFWRYLTNRL